MFVKIGAVGYNEETIVVVDNGGGLLWKSKVVCGRAVSLPSDGGRKVVVCALTGDGGARAGVSRQQSQPHPNLPCRKGKML